MNALRSKGTQYLLKQQSRVTAERRAARQDLDQKIHAKYPKLTEGEIKMLVVDDKWMAHLSAAVQNEIDRVSQTLTGRIRQLAERYATPLPELIEKVEALATRVDGHLSKMQGTYSADVENQANRNRHRSRSMGGATSA